MSSAQQSMLHGMLLWADVLMLCPDPEQHLGMALWSPADFVMQ